MNEEATYVVELAGGAIIATFCSMDCALEDYPLNEIQVCHPIDDAVCACGKPAWS